jgi:hypothetical protein
MQGVEIQITEGTVPCVWHPSSDQLVEAGLVVGAGFADELLADHGLTHLAEHLIYGACRQLPAAETAYVTTLHTAFFARGTAEDVSAFFDAVGRAMTELPVDRLEHEVQVLTAERRERPPGALAELDARRFGPNGPGLASWPEYGLRKDADALRAFVGPRFVAPRAVSWMVGPDPLEVSLPEGSALDPDARSVADRIVVPAWTSYTEGSVVWSSVVATGWASSIASAVLSDRLMERLRHEDAAVYADRWSGVRIGSGRSLLAAQIETAGSRQAERTVAYVIEVLDELASAGPSEREFSAIQHRHQLNLERPSEVPSILHALACHAVEAGRHPENGGPIAALLAVQPDDVRGAAATMRASLALGVPTSVNVRIDGITLIDDTRIPVEGERFFGIGTSENHAVVLSDDAIGVASRRGKASGVRFGALAAGVAEPGGVKLLVADDGSWVRVRAANFERCESLAAAIRERVPAALRVEPTRAERRVEAHLKDLVGGHGGTDYIQSLASGLDEDEEIRATGLARVVGGRAIAVVTDQRLILLAAGRPYDGGMLRLAEIGDVQHSRFSPLTVRFRAGSVSVTIETTKVAFARKLAELLRAKCPGEPRAAETVRAEAAWMDAQRTWRERLRNGTRVFGASGLFLVGGVALLAVGVFNPNEHEALVYGGALLARIAVAAVRTLWVVD